LLTKQIFDTRCGGASKDILANHLMPLFFHPLLNYYLAKAFVKESYFYNHSDIPRNNNHDPAPRRCEEFKNRFCDIAPNKATFLEAVKAEKKAVQEGQVVSK
jgi:hypothetical protein